MGVDPSHGKAAHDEGIYEWVGHVMKPKGTFYTIYTYIWIAMFVFKFSLYTYIYANI